MYFQSNDNHFCLYNGNSAQILGLLGQQVDVIFADPPYFLSNGGKKIQGCRMVSVDKGEWDKANSIDDIDNFNQEWIDACRPLLKDNGTIWACGTFHNIYSVEKCLKKAGFQIINIITWQKSDPTPTWGELHFNFSSEYIIWARKNPKSKHFFNYELMKQLNGGVLMPDVWKLPTVGMWEKTCGKHPTQKPLRLLYRIILASTKAGETVLDPFAGSCTTGIAANLLGRKFIGIDQNSEFLDLGIRRKHEIEVPGRSNEIQKHMTENPEEVTVMVNHAKRDTKAKMIETGICYLRAGESQGSLCVTPGFERMEYVLLHTGGVDCRIFRLKQKGCFQIWTKETLEQHGFSPSHAMYYIVLKFDNHELSQFKIPSNIKERINTYKAKIRPLSDFLDFDNY